MKVTERACNKCKEMKPLDGGFYRNKGMPDGLLKIGAWRRIPIWGTSRWVR